MVEDPEVDRLAQPVPKQWICVSWDCGSSSGRRLANEAMDLSDRLFRLAHLGRIEASCRGDLAHGWHKR
jgi:hypothetical protein